MLQVGKRHNDECTSVFQAENACVCYVCVIVGQTSHKSVIQVGKSVLQMGKRQDCVLSG